MTVIGAEQTPTLEASPAPQPKVPLVERRITGIVAPLVAVGILIGSWEIAGRFVNPVLISSPQEVASDFWGQFSRGTVTSALGISLRELYIGLVAGVVAGIFFGVLMGRYRILNSVFSPFVNAANATPLNVLIPLFLVWIGIGAKARILFILLITMFPVLLNTAAGMQNVSRGYVEVGKTLGMSERQLLRKVILPGAVPYIFAGIRIGTALAVIGMIVGEIELSNVGVGYLLNFYGSGFQTGDLLALVFLSAIIGVCNVGIVRAVQSRLFAWTLASR